MANLKYQDVANADTVEVEAWLMKFSDDELNTIVSAIKTEMVNRGQRRIDAAKAEIAASLEKQGLTLNDVFGKGPKSNGRGTVAIKYRNPYNPDQTWTGRGKRPNWLAEVVSTMSTEETISFLKEIEV